MGYRANYIVKRAGEWMHTSSQADALEIDTDFVFGPQAALRFLAPWPQWNFADWQIETSCQGGVLIDVDAEILMLFSDQPGYADRAVLLDTLARTWPGWDIRWAYNGLADLLRQAGVDAERGRPYGTRHESELYPFGRSGAAKAMWTLVTVRDHETVRAYGLDGNAVHPWWVGSNVLSMLASDTEVDSCPYIPDAGLHIDQIDKSAGLWSGTTALHDIADEWESLWPGWQLRFWGDDYHQHSLAARGAVNLPEADLTAARKGLARRVRAAWQPYLTVNADAYLIQHGQTVEQLRESDWRSFVALQTALAPDDLAGTLAAIDG